MWLLLAAIIGVADLEKVALYFCLIHFVNNIKTNCVEIVLFDLAYFYTLILRPISIFNDYLIPSVVLNAIKNPDFTISNAIFTDIYFTPAQIERDSTLTSSSVYTSFLNDTPSIPDSIVDY